MPKYLVKASYTAQGAKGLISEGGTARREAVTKVTESLGGKLECLYFAFGEADLYAVIDLPDNESALATSLVVNASGAVATQTIVLLTPEEVDAAAKKEVDFRPAGG